MTSPPLFYSAGMFSEYADLVQDNAPPGMTRVQAQVIARALLTHIYSDENLRAAFAAGLREIARERFHPLHRAVPPDQVLREIADELSPPVRS